MRPGSIKALLAGLVVLALGAVALVAIGVPPAGEGDGEEGSRARSGQAPIAEAGTEPDRAPESSGSSCQRLAGLAAAAAGEKPDPAAILQRLGEEAAGIRAPPQGLLDLAGGGTNLIPGGGFLAPFDDGTPGQARHFAGIAVATSYGGGGSTRSISIFLRDDAPSSADGRLTDRAISFARALLAGRLAPSEAGDWILERVCAS